jgi:23S rRNA (pseudouridine1915-N3)-methyltransferase
MKIKLLVVGKTDNIMLLELIETFQKRINRYLNFSIEIIPDSKQRKKLSKEKQKSKEGELIINKLMANDRMFLFDENGKSFSSVDFSNLIQKQMNSGIKQIVMVIGGPYGFSNSVYEKAYSKNFSFKNDIHSSDGKINCG